MAPDSSSSLRDEDVAPALERLLRVLLRLDTPGSLSLSAASTLSKLARSGPLRLTDLVAAEHVTQPAMTQLVTRLERDGLAVRGADPEDGRAVLVSITDAGRRLVADRRASRASEIETRFAELSPADRAAIAAAIPALGRFVDLSER